MTTIAFKKGVMACNGRISDIENQIHMDNFNKLAWCGEYLIGFSGSVADFENVKVWCTDGMDPDAVPEGEWHCLVWDSVLDQLMDIDDTGKFMLYPDGNYAAIGSGGKYAMVAMYCGKGAKQAVSIASRHDAITGGKMFSLSLADKLLD